MTTSTTIPGKLSIATTLTNQLRDAILRGQIKPDTKLRLEELGATYGVSLSPVREALLRLSGEGLVVGAEQRGFRAAQTSIDNLAEVMELRSHLEPLALRLGMERGGVRWEEQVVGVFHRLTRIEEQDGYVPFLDEWEQAHRDFHLALVSGCNLPMLVQFCSMLHDQSDRYRRLYLKKRPPQRNVAREHADIVKAVLARDPDKACQLMFEHSRQTGEAVLAFMKQPELKPPRRRKS